PSRSSALMSQATGLMLRGARSARLEAWPPPPFETAASQLPQDEGGERGANVVSHRTQIPSDPPASPRSPSANNASSGTILLIMPGSKVERSPVSRFSRLAEVNA